MINKRLIGTVPDSKPYIAGNVALQWLSLLSNAGMIFSCAWFLQQLLEGAAAPRTLALPLAAGLAAVLVRGICTAGAGHMHRRCGPDELSGRALGEAHAAPQYL